MMSLDINQFVNEDNIFIYNLDKNIKFCGKMEDLVIIGKHNELDLSDVECNNLVYDIGCILNDKHLLPKSLKELDISDTKIISFPKLPDSLENLYCSNCKLNQLPTLPKLLKELWCSYNNLTELPELPNSLKYLNVSFNNLTELPKFPNLLEEFFSVQNKISYLPEIPNTLKDIKMGHYPVESLPENFNFDQFNTLELHLKIDDNHSEFINSKEGYLVYLGKIKTNNHTRLIKELNKLKNDDIIKLYKLYTSLGNIPKYNIKLIDDEIWVKCSEKISLQLILLNMIECDVIKYTLIYIYDFDSKLF